MKKKLIYRTFFKLMAFLLILTVISTSILLVIKSNPKNNIQTKPIQIIHKKFKKSNPKVLNNFFPKKLKLEKIYKLIRIKLGKPFFKKELTSLIINQVITEGSFINGKLNYWYDFTKDNTNLLIAFKWESSSGEIQEKTYNVKIII